MDLVRLKQRKNLSTGSNIQSPNDLDWLIVEDFNYVRYLENRNRARREVQDMLKFNEAISNLGIVEIYL
jgi:hypothetical protein